MSDDKGCDGMANDMILTHLQPNLHDDDNNDDDDSDNDNGSNNDSDNYDFVADDDDVMTMVTVQTYVIHNVYKGF